MALNSSYIPSCWNNGVNEAPMESVEPVGGVARLFEWKRQNILIDRHTGFVTSLEA